MPLPRVSVVVPFFNVCECVEYCLRSLGRQTYRDFEIVAVDDGSTDATGHLLDEFKMDVPLRVFHKKNGGLSDARNYGVEHAVGTYVSFVDGDDFVSPHYLEYLVRAQKEFGVEHVVGRPVRVMGGDDTNPSYEWGEDFSARSVDAKELVRCHLRHNPEISACAHLAPRDVYARCPFAVGKRHEDMLAFSGQVLCSESFALVDGPIYGYVCRSGSITRSAVVSRAQIEDFKDALRAVEGAVSPFLPELERETRCYRAVELSRLYRLSLSSELSSLEKTEIRQEASGFARKNMASLLMDGDFELANKVRCLVLALVPSAYGPLFEIYEKQALTKEKPAHRVSGQGCAQ